MLIRMPNTKDKVVTKMPATVTKTLGTIQPKLISKGQYSFIQANPMQCVFPSASVTSNARRAGSALLLDESISLALAAAGQIAFDWHIADDRLYLSGGVTEELKSLLPGNDVVWTTATLATLIHDSDKPTFYRKLHEALRGEADNDGAMHRIRLRLQDSQLGWRHIEISGKVIKRSECGRALRMAGIFADMQHAAPAESEDEVTAQEKINGAILTAALDCIVSINHLGEIISFNQSAEQTFGYASTDVIGKKLADVIIPSEWREHHHQGLERYIATGESTLLNRRIEVTALHADGSTFPVEMAVVPVTVDNRPVFTAFIRDISELKQTEAILKDSARRYRQLVDLSPEAILVVRQDALALLNRAALRLFGVSESNELLGRNIFNFIDADFHALFRECAYHGRSDVPPPSFVEQRWERPDGAALNVEIGISKVIFDDAPALQVVVRDITERKRAEAIQLGQNRILNMIATGVELPEILTEIARFVEGQSERGLCAIMQLDAERNVLGAPIAPSLPAGYLSGIGELPVTSGKASCGTAAYRGEPVIVKNIETDPLWAEHRTVALMHGLKACASWPIFSRNRNVLGTFALYMREATSPTLEDLQLFSICTDLAGIAIESRASEERIRYLAHYDGLTSLPNRFLFKEYLDLALRNAQRHGNRFAVLFLDLDKFKEINDTLGHDAGDHVLREIARRMRSCLRETDKIARMGGDEFYVLIEELEHGRYAAEVAQKLLHEAARPIMVNGTECRLSVSIGIGIYPEDGTTSAVLLKNADNAMYGAKERGKNAFHFFSTPAANDYDAATSFQCSSALYWLDGKRVGVS